MGIALRRGSVQDVTFFLEAGRAGALLEALGTRDAIDSAVIPLELHVAETTARRREARASRAYRRALAAGKPKPVREARKALDEAMGDVREAISRIQREARKGAAIRYPDDNVRTQQDLEDYARQYGRTSYHPTCTCKMGVDEMAVVDQYGHVHGLEALRVADASIMPDCIRANTDATTIMIGERIADFARESFPGKS